MRYGLLVLACCGVAMAEPVTNKDGIAVNTDTYFDGWNGVTYVDDMEIQPSIPAWASMYFRVLNDTNGWISGQYLDDDASPDRHATQETAGVRPVITNVVGVYSPYFDGAGDFIYLANDTTLTNMQCISFWIYSYDRTRDERIMSWRTATAGFTWELQTDDSFHAYVQGAWNGDTASCITESNWHHVVFNFLPTGQNAMATWVDTTNKSGDCVWRGLTNPNSSFDIGKDDAGNSFRGLLREVIVYDRPLTGAEITNIWTTKHAAYSR